MTQGKIRFKRENLSNIKTIFSEKTGVETKMRNSGHSFRKTAAVLVAAAVCVMAALPAMAAGDGSYEILYAIAPKTAQYFRPVNMESSDKGITMQVESAAVQDDTIEVKLSLYDTQGDRIDETTDLFDSYSIHTPYSTSGTCKNMGYDEETGKITFIASLKQWGGKKISGDKITFSFSEFISNKREFEGEISGGLSNIKKAAGTRRPENIRGGSNGYDAIKTVLKTDGEFSPVPGVTLTGWGYVDGKLHIQAYFEDILHTDNHGYIYFKDENGEEIKETGSVSFWDKDGVGSFDEMVFDISPDELDSLTMFGYFCTCDTFVDGNWSVTFPIE